MLTQLINMLNELIAFIGNLFFRLKHFLLSKRIVLLSSIVILLIFYDIKLFDRVINKNNGPEIIYSSNLCFLPTWRDDLSNSERTCFGDCCSNSTFNLKTDYNCILSCKPSLTSFHKANDGFFTFLPIRIVPMRNKKVISFSLYGSTDRYLRNSIKVMRAYKGFLPDWISRFYVGSDVPPLLINRFIHEGAEVIMVNQNNEPPDSLYASRIPSYHGMFWRFFVADDVNVDRYLVRDTDSLPIQREIDAINAWISEKQMFHVMRDHYQHATEILGGMWGGIVNPSLFNLSSWYEKALVDGYDDLDGNWVDQHFLKYYVWPIAQFNMTCHVSYRWFFVVSSWGCKDFPTKRIGQEYVGAVID